MADWYYIGHFGQLGPLTREQIDDLIQGGVIGRDTYVWHPSLVNWMQAGDVRDLAGSFRSTMMVAPPPPPMAPSMPIGTAVLDPTPEPPAFSSYSHSAPVPASSPAGWTPTYAPAPLYSYAPTAKSDRSRIAAGLLNIFLPGVGRMYLGYGAIGVLQLFVTIVTCTVGWLWPLVDGVLILAGVVKFDGYGRRLED